MADATKWVVGGTKLAALLQFKMGSAGVDWSKARSVMSVCTRQTNSPLPSTLVIHSGAANTGAKCTGVFSYTVDAHNANSATKYAARI